MTDENEKRKTPYQLYGQNPVLHLHIQCLIRIIQSLQERDSKWSLYGKQARTLTSEIDRTGCKETCVMPS